MYYTLHCFGPTTASSYSRFTMALVCIHIFRFLLQPSHMRVWTWMLVCRCDASSRSRSAVLPSCVHLHVAVLRSLWRTLAFSNAVHPPASRPACTGTHLNRNSQERNQTPQQKFPQAQSHTPLQCPSRTVTPTTTTSRAHTVIHTNTNVYPRRPFCNRSPN